MDCESFLICTPRGEIASSDLFRGIFSPVRKIQKSYPSRANMLTKRKGHEEGYPGGFIFGLF